MGEQLGVKGLLEATTYDIFGDRRGSDAGRIWATPLCTTWVST